MKIRWIVVGTLLAVVAAGLVAIWPEAKEIYAMKKQEREMRNLETEVVRIELAGQHFDVPMRYMYGQAIEKYHQWSKAKKERVKVDYLSLSVLLPDLKPYYTEDDAKWKVRGHGDRVEVTIAFKDDIKNAGGLRFLHERILEGVAAGKYQRIGEVHGLIHIDEKAWQSYLPADGRELKISCHGEGNVPSPSCNVLSYFRPGVVLDYYYGLNHLPRWREIDDGLKSMFDQFAQAAQSEQSIKEE